jgi:hypothetical protein
MALIYKGPPNTFYAKVTVGNGTYRRTLEPIPGERYDVDDPQDGNWEPETPEKVAVADKGPVLADTTKDAQNEPTGAEEGN